MWTLKYSPGVGEKDKPEERKGFGDRKGAARSASANHDAGGHLEERGDPEVPSGTCCGIEKSPGFGGPSARGCQQSTPLRPADGVGRYVFRPTNAPNPGEVLPLH